MASVALPQGARLACRLRPKSAPLVSSAIPRLHDSDLVLCRAVQLIHQRVDLGVGALNLALVGLLVGRGRGPGHGFAVKPRSAALPALRTESLRCLDRDTADRS